MDMSRKLAVLSINLTTNVSKFCINKLHDLFFDFSQMMMRNKKIGSRHSYQKETKKGSTMIYIKKRNLLAIVCEYAVKWDKRRGRLGIFNTKVDSVSAIFLSDSMLRLDLYYQLLFLLLSLIFIVSINI